MSEEAKRPEFKFSDDPMFKRVMKNEDICKGVIERVLDKPIDRVKLLDTEQEIRVAPSKKVMRADAYLVESEGRVFDVEMQTGFNPELPMRFRGYQAIMDASSLWSGDDYDELKESYIIFMCTFDPFGAGYPIYMFRQTCAKDPSVGFDCRTGWVVANASAFEAVEDDDKLKSLLKYVQTGKATKGDELVARISGEVARNNSDREWVESMFSSIEIARQEARVQARREGRAEGLREGRAEGRAEGREQGRAEGREQGRAEGREQGRAEGEERLSRLVNSLIERGRFDDVAAASSDPEKREKLYSEFGI